MDQQSNKINKIYNDFLGKREALLKSLTSDSDKLFNGCNADTNKPLALVGLSNGNWRLEQLEQNCANDLKIGLIDPSSTLFEKYTWLNATAKRADEWLLSISLDEANTLKLDKTQRARLLEMIREVPSILHTIQDEDFRGEREPTPKSCGMCNKYVYIEQYWLVCTHCSMLYHARCLNIEGEVDEEHANCPSCGKAKISDVGSLGGWEKLSEDESDSSDSSLKMLLIGETESIHCYTCKVEILDPSEAIHCSNCQKPFHATCVQDNVINLLQGWVCENCKRDVGRLENALARVGDGDKKCRACDELDNFWVSCVRCHEDYHGKCVEVLSWATEKIKQFKCRKCIKKNGYKITPVIKRLTCLYK